MPLPLPTVKSLHSPSLTLPPQIARTLAAPPHLQIGGKNDRYIKSVPMPSFLSGRQTDTWTMSQCLPLSLQFTVTVNV
ncbi:hypothetical protein EXN66_Car001802 [Channa argus]|uniref:Uncharacterized protein n=1 Tax=Channa argus TaxID=215402 RepID=A0A6G1P753_CHAAH|nr:hypothetical protein EXN66_Car001802 [Channa argus]